MILELFSSGNSKDSSFEVEPVASVFQKDAQSIPVLSRKELKDEDMKSLQALRDNFARMKAQTGQNQLLPLLECLTQITSLLSTKSSLALLQEIEIVAEQLHSAINLWELLACCNENRILFVNQAISLMISLPEKFISVFEETSSIVGRPLLFQEKIHRDFLSFVQNGNSLLPTHRVLVGKICGSGFLDELCQLIVAEPGMPTIVLVDLINVAGTIYLDTIMSSLLQAVDIVFTDPFKLMHYLRCYVVQIFRSPSIHFASFLNITLKYQNVSLQVNLALLSLQLWSEDKDFMLQIQTVLFRFFSNFSHLKRASATFNTFITHHVLIFLSFISKSDLEEDGLLLKQILDGISKRIDHPESAVRIQGMILGEILSRLSSSQEPLDFELNKKDEVVSTFFESFRLAEWIYRSIPHQLTVLPCEPHMTKNKYVEILTEDYPDVIVVPSIPAKSSDDDVKINNFTQLKTNCSDNAPPRNAKIKKPLFLLDVLTYLRTDEPEKHEMALSCLESLLASAYWAELEGYAPTIFKHLLFASDQFRLKNFEEMRISALVGITFKLPSQSLHILVDQFLGKSLNLGQKSDILTITMSCLKILISNDQKQLTKNPELEALIQAMKIHSPFGSDKKPERLTISFLSNGFFLSLLRQLQNSRAVVFATAHDFLLEKTLMCFGMFLLVSNHCPEFPKMIVEYFNFIRPLIGNKDISYPIIRAALCGIEALIQRWPDYIPLLEHFRILSEIAHWINSLSYCDDEIIVDTCGRVNFFLGKLVNPSRIISENCSQLEMKELKMKL